MTKIATKIVNLREVKGLTQSYLAERVPIQKSYLSRIEKGTNYNIGRKILRGLANTLDVSIDYLENDQMDESNRSWEKVATDESLALFLRKVTLTEKERIRLRKISFTESAPRSLEEWQRLWNNLSIYNKPTKSMMSQPSTRVRKNAINEKTEL